MHSLERSGHRLFKATDMPSHRRVFVGFHTDVSLFGRNRELMEALSTNFEVNSDFDIPNMIHVKAC